MSGAASDKRRWTPRLVDHPRTGYFAARMVRGGAEVAVQVHCGGRVSLFNSQATEHWWLTVNGVERVYEAVADPLTGYMLMMVLNHGKEISKSEYLALLDVRRGIDPFVAVDLKSLPLPF